MLLALHYVSLSEFFSVSSQMIYISNHYRTISHMPPGGLDKLKGCLYTDFGVASFVHPNSRKEKQQQSIEVQITATKVMLC